MKRLTISRFPELSYACSEAINALCTNLSFSGADVRRVMVTSCQTHEGKSFVSMNTMRTMAELGKSVVLIDADLRRSAIQTNYGVQYEQGRGMGLTHYLAGMAGLEDVLYATDIEGAYMVPVGHEVFNSLPLLASSLFQELLDDLAKRADYVLVDAPPIGMVIDAAEIAKTCDGTLLVVSYDRVKRQELLEAKEQLEQSGTPILGTVLNMVKLDSYLNKKYYYKSYNAIGYGAYNPTEENAKRVGRKKLKGE